MIIWIKDIKLSLRWNESSRRVETDQQSCQDTNRKLASTEPLFMVREVTHHLVRPCGKEGKLHAVSNNQCPTGPVNDHGSSATSDRLQLNYMGKITVPYFTISGLTRVADEPVSISADMLPISIFTLLQNNLTKYVQNITYFYIKSHVAPIGHH